MKMGAETFGHYSTKLTTILNTAMATWSGFNYQGLCAIYCVLDLLKKDWENNKDKYLSLEAYEDFAILDVNKNIESFHQCKCIAEPKNYDDECKKMNDKREYWTSENKCKINTPLYFHSNQNNILTCGVLAYDYPTENHTCSSDELFNLIKERVVQITNNRNLPGSSEIKKNKLIVLIINNVEKLHQVSIANPGISFENAKDNPISFKTIIQILENPNSTYELSEKIITCRSYLINNLNKRLLERGEIGDVKNKIEKFISKIESLDFYTLNLLINRLYPNININTENIEELVSKTYANNLYNVITRVIEELDYPSFNWSDGDENLSPSTIGMDKDPEEYCNDIIQNPFSNDLIRDYRWIVGHIDHTVEDVEAAAQRIDVVSEIHHEDITRGQKIGLLKIVDKNGKKY